MDYEDKIEVFVGFLDGSEAWLEGELLRSGKVNFDPADHVVRHIVLANEPDMKSLIYRYVRCLITFRHLLNSARAGMEGERIGSITLYSITRPSVRDIFKRNCLLGANETMRVPPDIDETLDALLSVRGVHVMQEKSMMYGGSMVVVSMNLFDSMQQFIERVQNELSYGKQVFLYSVLQRTDGDVEPERLNLWRWIALPEE